MFKAVIFDLDGVITDTAQFHFVAWKKLGEKLGIPLSESFNEELKGVDRTESLRRILALGSMENQFTDKEKEAFATEKNDFYVQLIEQLTPEDILPGISALLVELTEANIQIGLASASKNAPKILQNLNLMDTFDTIVNPELLTKGKPDPEIFIRAAEQLNVTPNQCIGIEDAYSGVQAINDAKMISIGVGDLETLKAATAVVPDTSYLSLEQLIQQWNK